MVGSVMERCEAINECIACGSTHLVPLLDLGSQPLANSFIASPEDSEETFPLATNYCKNCFHIQLTHKVHPDLLFKNYLYVSGTAKTQLLYFDWFANFVQEKQKRLVSVLDIGCNDGSMLDAFAKMGSKRSLTTLQTFGVDPAENLHPISSAKGHAVHCGYFDQSFPGTYDAIVCMNAFAHNYDQLAFLKNMKRVVDDEGYIYITTSQADMVSRGEYDTIYHEHLSFYNIRSMNELCKRAGLNIVEVVKHPIHGNSFIFVISPYEKREAYIDLLLMQEQAACLYDESTLEWYAESAVDSIKEFAATIRSLRPENIVVGYGAPAKGNTLLNAGKVKLDFIIDDNPLKQNLYSPGMHIPVYSSKILKEFDDQNLVFVPLAWNFFHEIKANIKQMRPGKKDLFLKTFPTVHME